MLALLGARPWKQAMLTENKSSQLRLDQKVEHDSPKQLHIGHRCKQKQDLTGSAAKGFYTVH